MVYSLAGVITIYIKRLEELEVDLISYKILGVTSPLFGTDAQFLVEIDRLPLADKSVSLNH
jgi:hypothetical protein